MSNLSSISATETDDTMGMIAPAVTFGGLVAAAAVGATLGAVTGVALGAAYYAGYQDGKEAAEGGDKPKNR